MKEAKDREKGQVSLFSMLGEDDDFAGTHFQLGGSDEEFPDKQIQLFEKEFLGFYVTSHPLSSIRDKLPFLMTHKISELEEVENEKVVTICGLITTMRQIPTKKDPSKFIRFLTLEDLTGKVEAVAFNAKIQEFGESLQTEQKVIISGKLQRRDEDQISILIDNVKPVDNSSLVTITLKDDFKYEELCAVKDVLVKYKGSDPVIMKTTEYDVDTKILLSSMFWVNATNDLIQHLNKIFPDRLEVSMKSLDAKD